VIKGLACLLEDKNIKVRFIAMEALSYLTTIKDSDKIMMIANKKLYMNKAV
jgi:hypothetical protein